MISFFCEVDDLELEPITDHSEAPVVVHGTYHDCWPQIKAQVSTMSFSNLENFMGGPCVVTWRTKGHKHCMA